MRIPSHYKRPGWQRFFAGIFIGILIGWTFFIYQFGHIHDDLIIKLRKQELTITNQNDRIETLLSDQKKLNEENQKNLTVQEIDITFTNARNLKLNELTVYELRQHALNELKFLEGKNISTVAATRELMLKAVENKIFKVGETRYRLTTKQFVLYTTIELHMKIEIVFN